MVLLVTFAQGRDTAQARVEALLVNVLPAEVAQRLQSDPNSIADHFDEVSILFADVVNFTPLSSELDAREVVSVLDRLFTSFDDLVDRYEVEKIKTIGDCYMVAAGVPRQRPDHAQALAGLALEMGACAQSCVPEGAEHDLRLRIGISSGPVVAGVIGRRRFLYDLWGDTVNMASRMESHGSCRRDPDHSLDVGALARRLRRRAARARRREGQGPGRDLAARRPAQRLKPNALNRRISRQESNLWRGRRGGETAVDDVLRLERAKRGPRRRGGGRVLALPLRLEALPGSLALPDSDDPEALVGRACDMDHETLGSCRDRGGEVLVLFPGGRDVLNEGIRHAQRLGRTALVSV